MNFRFLSPLFVAVVVMATTIGCAPDTPQLKGFDKNDWTSDKGGCAGKRSALADTLLAQRESLLAQPESGIIAAIGKPDLVELYKRNQKFFHYFTDGGPGCGGADRKPSQLVIRFNAMGRAKEIIYEK